jgi:hypothetical protein
MSAIRRGESLANHTSGGKTGVLGGDLLAQLRAGCKDVSLIETSPAANPHGRRSFQAACSKIKPGEIVRPFAFLEVYGAKPNERLAPGR